MDSRRQNSPITQPMRKLTHEQLLEWLSYDAETGKFVWLVDAGGRHAGAVAGGLDGEGYLIIKVNGGKYYQHRLAWFYVHGVWPSGVIDRRNGLRADNRLSNLRDTTCRGNVENQRKPQASNRSGFMGVFLGWRGDWRACIKVNGRTIHLGKYETPLLAHEAYIKAKREMHAGCTL